MKVSDVYRSKYFKAADLNNQSLTATIKKVSIEELGPEKDRKPVAYFHEFEKGHTKQEAMEILAGAGVLAGATLNTQEILEDKHLIEREMILTVEDPVRGDYQMIGCPVKLSDEHVEVTPAAEGSVEYVIDYHVDDGEVAQIKFVHTAGPPATIRMANHNEIWTPQKKSERDGSNG